MACPALVLTRRYVGVVPDPSARRQRLGLFRQRPGIAGARRPLGAARPDDDDARGVRAAVLHFDRQAGVLRVSCGDHGALGRPGGDGLYRRPSWSAAPWTATVLRPCRYVVTTDGLVVLSSEVGVIEFPPEQDPAERASSARPDVPGGYRRRADRRRQRDQRARSRGRSPIGGGLDENRIELRGLFRAFASRLPSEPKTLMPSGCAAFGYTREELQTVSSAPMAVEQPGARGLDGHRHAAGRALRPAQAVVQLFQATVCPM